MFSKPFTVFLNVYMYNNAQKIQKLHKDGVLEQRLLAATGNDMSSTVADRSRVKQLLVFKWANHGNLRSSLVYASHRIWLSLHAPKL